MFKELHDAVRVENVAAGEARAGFCTELGCVAYAAQFILINSIVKASLLCARSIEAGKAFVFIWDAPARVSTGCMSLIAENDSGLLLLALIDHNLFFCFEILTYR